MQFVFSQMMTDFEDLNVKGGGGGGGRGGESGGMGGGGGNFLVNL